MMTEWLKRIVVAAVEQKTHEPAALPPAVSSPQIPTSAPKHATQAQVEAGAAAFRKMVTDAGYGSFVSDRNCWDASLAVVEAALAV